MAPARLFDGAIDRRRAVTRTGARPVGLWHGRVTTGPHVIWPPVHRDEQLEYARAVVTVKHAGAALVTVLHRRGATCVIVVDVFGRPLDDGEQAAVRRVLERLTPAPFFSVRPWVAVDVGPLGRLHDERRRARAPIGGRPTPTGSARRSSNSPGYSPTRRRGRPA